VLVERRAVSVEITRGQRSCAGTLQPDGYRSTDERPDDWTVGSARWLDDGGTAPPAFPRRAQRPSSPGVSAIEDGRAATPRR